MKRLLLLLLLLPMSVMAGKKCLLVMSYHKGYEWNDGIERAVRRELHGRCELKVFYMDTKRNTSEEWGKQQAIRAKNLIGMFRPDVVIASDDNASRYLVKPYYRNARLPFVFCGINWSADEYGYPYRNTTGMIEIAPVASMIKHLRVLIPNVRHGIYLSSNTRTEHKDYERFRSIFSSHGIQLDAAFVSSMASWKTVYLKAQKFDFVLIGNNAGITDWDSKEISVFALGNAQRLSVSFYQWMMPYSAFALTKRPEEQGSWAGKTALAILSGLKPSDIPVVVNRHWDMWVNPAFFGKIGMRVPVHMQYRARLWK